MRICKLEFDSFDKYCESKMAKYDEVLSIVKGGSHGKTRYCADLTTNCKCWQTAVRRFFKALAGDTRFEGWQDGITEACENGSFHEIETFWNDTTQRSEYQGGWHWTVEAVSEDLYYIELTVEAA